MVHKVQITEPVSNNDIVNLYCENLVTVANAKTFISPGSTLAEPFWPLKSGELVQVQSSSALDAGPVRVVGLDLNFIRQTEVVLIPAGGVAVTTKQFTRINDIEWLSTTPSQGDITVSDVGNLKTYMKFSQEAQYVLDGIHTCPADRLWRAEQLYAAITRDNNSQAIGFVGVFIRFLNESDAFIRPFKFGLSSRGNSSQNYINTLPQEFNGPVDIYLAALVSDVNTEVVTRFSFLQKTQQ